MPDIQAIIFDMGGVLLRTDDPSYRLALGERLGRTRAELESLVFTSESSQAAERGDITFHEHWKQLGDYLGLDEQEMHIFRREWWAGDRMDVELVDFIRSLRGRYKTALLSNAWDVTREIVKKIYDYSDAFDVMIYSAEVKLRKPETQIFHLVCEQLGVSPSQAVFIDDVEHNIEGARRAGLHGILFRSTHQVKTELQALIGG